MPARFVEPLLAEQLLARRQRHDARLSRCLDDQDARFHVRCECVVVANILSCLDNVGMSSQGSSPLPIAPLPCRILGQTGQSVTLFGLGGEGVLRTHGRAKEAVRVIQRALDQGVTYCDTAPAYASSMDYYGAALGERRQQIFLASKTHDRTRDGSLRLLDDSLRRLRTDYLDLWQLHDLRTPADLD